MTHFIGLYGTAGGKEGNRVTFYVSKILQFEVVLKVEGAKSYFCLSFSIRDLFASLMGRE